MNRFELERRTWTLLAVLVFTASAAAAFGQTPFALRNVGQKVDSEDARMLGRGGWGMAVRDSVNPGFKNPAGLSALRHVTISLSGYGVSNTSTDGTGERTVTRVMAPDFRLAVPVLKGRMAVTAGFEMDRSFRYVTYREFEDYARGDTLQGYEQFLRRGTLFSVPMGLAVEPVEGLSLGGSVNLVRGSVSESLYENFTSPTNSSGDPFYQNVVQVQKDTYLGTSTTWSALYSWNERVRMGALWTPAYDVDVERDRTLADLVTHWTDAWTMRMPDEYQAGLQARLTGRWWVGGDWQLQKFSEFEGPAEWLDDGMEDETSWSVGAERMIAYERHGGMNNWPLRLGMGQRRWAYRVGGEPVDETTFSVGTGFPFRGRLGVLDVALSYSRIGDLEKNGLEDSVWRMAVSVKGLERWW